MIDREHDLAVVCEAKVLTLARSNKPRPVSVEDLALMRRLDELHLDYPFAGARMLRDLLRREGVPVGWRHVATLMKRRGLAAIYRRPNMSKPAPGPKIYPYLLRGLKIERPNQAWSMDISCIPMRRGFVYLTAVVDVFSWRVLAHRVSITMAAGFCIDALEEALARQGRPAIFNTDQGRQFTGLDFTGVRPDAKVAISMDGKGAWRENVSSSGCGERSTTRRSICAPATAYPRRGLRSPDIWRSTIRAARIRALTGARPTRLISARTRNGGGRMTVVVRFCRGSALVGLRPPGATAKPQPAFSVPRQEST